MVKRQTWVLLAVFAALIGVAALWTSYQNNRQGSNPTPTPTPEQFLFSVDNTAVASLKITDNLGNHSVMVGRDINGQWALIDPPAEYTDVSSVEAAVTQLTSMRVTSSISSTVDLAEYGLDLPAYTITLNVNGGGQLLAQVGSPTATSSGYYVLVPGGVPQIISKNSLDAVLKLLTNPPFATPTTVPTATGAAGSTAFPTSTPAALSATPSQPPAVTEPPAFTPTATLPQITSTTAPKDTNTPLAATPTETAKP